MSLHPNSAPVPAPIVVCVGIVTVDLVAVLDRELEPRLKQRASRIVASPGGAAATAAAAAAKLGITARLVARVGDDEREATIRGWLGAAGVEDLLLLRAGIGSATSLVTIDPGGERTIVNATAAGLVGPLDASDLEHLARAMEGAGAVCADVRWPAGAQAALEHAATAGVPGVLDLDRSLPDERERMLRLVRTATHVFASEPGLSDLIGTTDVDMALAELAALMLDPADPADPALPVTSFAGPRVVGVTLGASGVRWRCVEPGPDATPRTSPAPVVETLETLGAGDVWHGVCAGELARGATTERAIEVASAAAALRCTRRGGWDALASAAQVEALLERSA